MQLVHWRLRIKFVKNILSINTIEKILHFHVSKKGVWTKKNGRKNTLRFIRTAILQLLLYFIMKSSV